MAVADQQPQPTPVQRLISAAQTGAVVQGAGAAAVAPAVAVAKPAQVVAGAVGGIVDLAADAALIAIVLRVLRRFFARKRATDVHWLETELRRAFPNAPESVLRAAIAQEMRFEEAFAAKAEKRVEADMREAAALQGDARKRRVDAILNREQHYVALRTGAMLARTSEAVHREGLKIVSPDGAAWVLGQAKEHTAGCVKLDGVALPWSVLDTVNPGTMHTGCQCSLRALKATEEPLQHGDAVRVAQSALALEEALRDVADPGEIDAYIAGEPVRPIIARALQESYEEALHPRGRGGHWIETGFKGFEGNPQAQHEAEEAVRVVQSRYDVPLKHVIVDAGTTDDVGRHAGKSKDAIYLSPKVLDDTAMAARTKDFRGALVEVPNDPHGRKRTVTHEYAHVLDGELLSRNRKAYDELDAFLNEKGSYGMPGERTRLQAGLEAPSAYGTENRYEFVAEALTDWIHNGEQAHPSSRFIGKLFDKYLGRAALQESYEEILHPRGRGGKWITKLGGKRLELKGEKKLTSPQVHARVKAVAKGLVDFYGGKHPTVHHEPEYLATVGSDARFRHEGQAASGLLYGQRIQERVKDPELGLSELRIVAHEAAHSLSGTVPGPLPGFSQTFEEGGAEILSLWFWHHKAQPLDERDAARTADGWTKGLDTLAHNVVYRDNVEEFMRRAASRVGWDRHAIIDEVERVMRGDHTVRLHFRDETDPHFPLPEDMPTMSKALGDDRSDKAVELIRWLVSEQKPGLPVKAGDVNLAELDDSAVEQRLVDVYQRNQTATEDQRWYADQHDVIGRWSSALKIDPTTFTAMVAATSPQMAWDQGKRLPNLEAAAAAVALARANPTVDIPSFVQGLESPGMLRNSLTAAMRIYRGEQPGEVLSGPKVRSFFNNLTFPTENAGVTVDTHMARLILGDARRADYKNASRVVLGGKNRGYLWAAARISDAAKRIGILPHELQAAAWMQFRRELV